MFQQVIKSRLINNYFLNDPVRYVPHENLSRIQGVKSTGFRIQIRNNEIKMLPVCLLFLQKDLKLSLNMGDQLEQPLPLTASANEVKPFHLFPFFNTI
jgi:hypothetical protein